MAWRGDHQIFFEPAKAQDNDPYENAYYLTQEDYDYVMTFLRTRNAGESKVQTPGGVVVEFNISTKAVGTGGRTGQCIRPKKELRVIK